MKFSSFALSEEMFAALRKLGYVEASPVQSATIPKALKGASLLAQSETGSGKTHAFLIPIIERIDKHLDRPQALIVAPTRELARQIFDFAREFQRFFPTFHLRLYTSESDVTDDESGRLKPPQLIIGTPGRLADLLVKRQQFSLRSVKCLVLDEADMLLDMGFFADIELLCSLLKDHQTMVYSATLKPNLKAELSKFLPNDFVFEGEKTETSSSVSHHLIDIKHGGELKALMSFLKIRKPYLCIVFASTVEKVNAIHKGLKENGFDAVYFSGSLDDRSRKKAIREIRSNRHSLIVSTDILSRGIDIPDISDVVSIDLPSDLQFYHHRAGRTGRFGKKGDSWVFYNSDSIAAPKTLIEEGVPFDFYELRGDALAKDPVGLNEKTKLRKKKELPEEERKEIRIAKAHSRPKSGKVEPMYKKKRQFAIEKVKRKYRKKAIRESIRKGLASKAAKENDR